jgi:hypothetical protein
MAVTEPDHWRLRISRHVIKVGNREEKKSANSFGSSRAFPSLSRYLAASRRRRVGPAKLAEAGAMATASGKSIFPKP